MNNEGDASLDAKELGAGKVYDVWFEDEDEKWDEQGQRYVKACIRMDLVMRAKWEKLKRERGIEDDGVLFSQLLEEGIEEMSREGVVAD